MSHGTPDKQLAFEDDDVAYFEDESETSNQERSPDTSEKDASSPDTGSIHDLIAQITHPEELSSQAMETLVAFADDQERRDHASQESNQD